MIEITNKINCCGCTACFNACPAKCISMVSDEEGFLYPQIDKSKCINCGLCEKVCPILNFKKEQNERLSASYIVRSKDKENLMQSTSGGFITPLANYVFEREGVFCASAYSNNFEVKHIIIESTNGAPTSTKKRGGYSYCKRL